MSKKLRAGRMRRINYGLVALIVIMNLYTMALPFIPTVSYWFKKKGTAVIPSGSHLSEQSSSDSSGTDLGHLSGDKLIIPSIGLSETIHTGTDIKTVNKGPWMRPNASTPDKGSNTVIVGHRFSYKAPSVFYSLDKIKVGDRFLVFWQGKEYNYEVSETRVVAATQVEIESPSSEPIMTLYTCTPIWTAKNRLVIIAKEVYGPNLQNGGG